MKIRLLALWVVAAVVVPGGRVVQAQTNSWTSLTSGHWEDPRWSLGILPTTNHSVMITNSGSKAVAIFPSTPINFPTNMTITNLTVSAPAGYTNTLLLNYSGMASPLRVLNRIDVGPGGIINNQYGALVFGQDCYIMQGSWIQAGGYCGGTNGGVVLVGAAASLNQARCEFISLGVYAGSVLMQTNCDIAANLQVQTGTCFFDHSSFRGSISIGQFGPGIQSGDVYQTGGTNFSDLDISKGNYTLVNGKFLGAIYLSRESLFKETNSLISAPSIGLGSYQDGSSWTAINSTNYTGSLDVGSGNFSQSGGVLVITNSLNVYGFFDDYGPVWFSSFGFDSGVLHCGNISVGVFGSGNQSSGTTIVDERLSANGGGFGLGGGMLQTSNTVVAPYQTRGDATFLSSFAQSGGTHLVTGALSVGGDYFLSGGTLSATNIFLTSSLGSSFMISSNAGSVPVIVNAGQFYVGGILRLSGSVQQLGKLVLTGNATFDFTQTPGQLRFLNSSAVLWSNDVTLMITNWVGSANGNGPNRLVVGNNGNGLTPAQLNQIRFINPGGFPNGTYFADILATGEVVPTIHPHLLASSVSHSLILTWPASFTLEWSTNLQGPYLAVPGAANPYTNLLTEPRRFFRLRQ